MTRIEVIEDFLDGCAYVEYCGNRYEYAGHVKSDDFAPKELHGKIILSNINNGDALYLSYDQLVADRNMRIVY